MTQMKEPEGIQDVFSWIGSFLKNLFTKAEPAMVTAIKNFYQAWEPRAYEIVSEEAKKVASGQEKFASAVATIGKELAQAGWEVAPSVIDTLIQDCYLAFKANNPPAPGQTLIKAPA